MEIGKNLYTKDGRICGNGRIVEHLRIGVLTSNVILFESGATATLNDEDIEKYFYEHGNCSGSIELHLSRYIEKSPRQNPNVKKEIDFQEQRMTTWRNAYCAVASAENTTKPETAIKWADKALESFDSKFSRSW